MRFLPYLCFLCLLGCSVPKDYTSSIQNSRSSNVQEIYRQYGTPQQQIKLANGLTRLVYHTRSKVSYAQTSPSIGVNLTREGRPAVITQPRTNYNWGMSDGQVGCTVQYDINRRGDVMARKSYGDCSADLR